MTSQSKAPRPEKIPSPTGDAYILGGADLEMSHIEKRLVRMGANVLSGMTTWEKADVSHRSELIDEARAQGHMPVLIEHRGADDIDGVIHIDHHGESTHKPAAILQVLERVGFEPRFIDKLVAANDSRHIPGMEDFLDGAYRKDFIAKRLRSGLDPATAEVRYQAARSYIIDRVRIRDRQAQGSTEEDEREAVEALEHMEDRNGLKIVTLRANRANPVTDRLYSTWEDGRENLVVVCASDEAEKEVWFFGPGDISREVQEHFAALKKQRIEADPNEPLRSGIYHTVGGGLGFGEADQNARCLVVASDPEEVIQYIQELEESKMVAV